MDNKYTPGPWEFQDRYERGSIVGVHAHYEIASLDFQHAWEDEQRTNARLIAAAPEMAEALAIVVASLEAEKHCDGSGWWAPSLGQNDVAKIRAALKKAGVP